MAQRDHGGGLDAATQKFGGDRSDWLDLSTGINPTPYPVGGLNAQDWTALPDRAAQIALTDAARQFWNVPSGAAVLAAPGASALIARIPTLAPTGRVTITTPTYNEHAAAFGAAGWQVQDGGTAEARVLVHPNNPDGRMWTSADANAALTVIDESFCDVTPDHSLIDLSDQPGRIILKSFGKFWGLAGVRLGFAIAAPDTIARLAETLGPWPVSGPALRIGATALQDHDWAQTTRQRLDRDALRLDTLMERDGATLVGGTSLFRLYEVADAEATQTRLARHHIWTRIFPYSKTLIRLGLPDAAGWSHLDRAV